MESHSPQIDFQTWSNRLHPPPIHARVALGTGTSSTSVSHTRVPVSVSRWHQFPEWVAMWKAEIMEKDLGGAQFEVLAKAHTRHYTVGALSPEVIRDEQSSRRTLEHFYSMVNHFHLDFHGALYPCLQQPRENTEVYANAGSVVQVRSNPDIVITDGTDNMLKVGLGEVKSPWVLTRRSIVQFMNRLPFTHFGEQFVGVGGQTEEILYTGKALTQLYNDLLTDRLSVGFVATPEAIIYCFIPPDNRTCLQIHYSPIWREIMDLVPPRFTPQVGLATLAWFAKTYFGGKKLMAPKNMRKWGDYSLTERRAGEQKDFDYTTNSFASRPPRSSNIRQYFDNAGYQYCTPLCLMALRSNRCHLNCPNARSHKSAKPMVLATIQHIKQAFLNDDFE